MLYLVEKSRAIRGMDMDIYCALHGFWTKVMERLTLLFFMRPYNTKANPCAATSASGEGYETLRL